jgi:hypothetical protein
MRLYTEQSRTGETKFNQNRKTLISELAEKGKYYLFKRLLFSRQIIAFF